MINDKMIKVTNFFPNKRFYNMAYKCEFIEKNIMFKLIKLFYANRSR